MREINSIDLVFENCEVIRIKREDIGIFHMSNIVKSISRSAMNSISEGVSAEEVYLQISSKANTQESFLSTWHDGEVTPFERIVQYGDITAIDINYQDETNEYIFVKWGGDSEYSNEYHSVAINENTGDLYLVISEKERASNYFEEYLSEETSEFWDLYLED